MDMENRGFGNNMRFYSHRKEKRLKWLAEQLECSECEVQKMMDARIFLDREERVAEILGVTLEVLYQPLEDRCYEEVGCFECRGEFSTPENNFRFV